MKTSSFHSLARGALCVLLAVSLIAADKPPAKLPQNVTLKSGAVLRNISIVRWQTGAVVLKHVGGTDPVRLDFLSDESRAALEAYRDQREAEDSKKADIGAPISGEVFIVTNGKTNVKLGSARVCLYANLDPSLGATLKDQMLTAKKSKAIGMMTMEPSGAAESRVENEWSKFKSSLPEPEASTYTNADGKFTINPKGMTSFSLLVYDQRLISDGRYERYLWIIPSTDIKDPQNLVLGAHNLIDLP